ncbi:MAG: Gfo/Idh/MocA family oxidoreductase [Planctomycetes bacterium]|nr:Gfo/Idh/MocA family oxidoreductase [Planctomycetota bacterium]
MTTKDLTFAILGLGGRGGGFSHVLHAQPELGRVVAIADPDPEKRKKIGDRHAIPADRRFEGYQALLAQPKLADVVINTLMDQLHRPSAVPALDKGYHMLLEKPMATSLEDCKAIDAARRRNNAIVSICHSMRYSVIFSEIKRLVDSGVIGDIVSLDQLEAVEHTHQSHSFVRGNWGNESRATFMLMAKSCHDIDFIAYLIGKPCRRVSSFGSLTKFRKENMPVGAPARCIDGCPAEASCPYSTYKLYSGPQADKTNWYSDHAGFIGKTSEERVELLKTSPYGRCVYQCDNDVVDHQVVAFEFDAGITATFTMTALTHNGGRSIRVHGTKGDLTSYTESHIIDIHRFDDGRHDRVQLPFGVGMHGGSDLNALRNLVDAIRTGRPDSVLTTTSESLASHTIVFAAERSRREKRMVEISDMG